MTDLPNAPVQFAGIEWSTNVAVSMSVTGAPGILAPCGHLLQPKAIILNFVRGSLPSQTKDWDLTHWEILVIHPDEGGLGDMELTLTNEHFGHGPGLEEVHSDMKGLADFLGLPIPKADLLGDPPEWVHTVIKSYQPWTDSTTPVRTSETYHS